MVPSLPTSRGHSAMALDPLNRLCKWRTVLAGWHHGTRSMNEPGTQAMRDLMDKLLVLRVESSAVAALLIKKGAFTAAEYTAQVYEEARELNKLMEKVFPGFKTSDVGIVITDQLTAAQTMKERGFPP